MGLNLQEATYMNACLIFNKAWMYNVSPSSFFCFADVANMLFEPLTKEQKKKAQKAYNPQFCNITPSELDCLADFY
jgi:hypothetical protein